MNLSDEVISLLRNLFWDELPPELRAESGPGGDTRDPQFLETKIRTGECLPVLIRATYQKNRNTLKYVFVDIQTIEKKLGSSSSGDQVSAIRMSAEGLELILGSPLTIDWQQPDPEPATLVVQILDSLAPRFLPMFADRPLDEADLGISKMTECISKHRNVSQVTSLTRIHGKPVPENASISAATRPPEAKSAIDFLTNAFCLTFKLNRKMVNLLGGIDAPRLGQGA